MELSNKLKNIETYPFHMPGHKRNKNLNINGTNIDITEIEGFDNLHNPKEVLSKLQNDIAEVFGYKKSIISVNGSTCCILSAISAISKENDIILIARNCHKSVYNACYINKLKIRYIEPEYIEDFSCYGKITQECADEALKKYPNACAIVLTSPTYEGIVSRIHAPVPVIVDSAHGAHFGFADYLPKRQDGDIIIQSLHKTLPALTQTAAVHINNEKLFHNVKKYMDIYESSSPSYILLNSVDKCVDFLKTSKKQFEKYKELLDYFYESTKALPHIKFLKNDDLTRIVFSADGYNGYELELFLRKKGIEIEGSTVKYVILISTVCDTKEGFKRLIHALKELPVRENKELNINILKLPQRAFEIYEADDYEKTAMLSAENKISAEYIYAYPPGVPIIAPGEIISKEIIEYISNSKKNNVNILSDSNLLPLKILTKKEY